LGEKGKRFGRGGAKLERGNWGIGAPGFTHLLGLLIIEKGNEARDKDFLKKSVFPKTKKGKRDYAGLDSWTKDCVAYPKELQEKEKPKRGKATQIKEKRRNR